MASREEHGWYRVGWYLASDGIALDGIAPDGIASDGIASDGIASECWSIGAPAMSTVDKGLAPLLLLPLCGSLWQEQGGARSELRERRTRLHATRQFGNGVGCPRRGFEEEGQVGGGLSRSSRRSPCGGG